MSLYSEENFIGKLRQLQDAQDSIPLVSHWMIYHRRYAKENVRTWYNELLKAPPNRKLVFIYLCNDVCQNSRGKGKEFIDTFRCIIKDAIVHSYCHSIQDVRKKIRRVLKVWEERKVFDSKVLGSIEVALDETSENSGMAEIEGHISPLPDFSATATEAPPLFSSRSLEVEGFPILPAKRSETHDDDRRDPRLKTRKSEDTEREPRNGNNGEVADFCDLSKLPEQLQALYHMAMKAYKPTSEDWISRKSVMQGTPNLAAFETSTDLEDASVREISEQQIYINCLKALISLEEDRLFRMKEVGSKVHGSDANLSVKDHLHLHAGNATSLATPCLQVNAISNDQTSIPEARNGRLEYYDSDAVGCIPDGMALASKTEEGMAISFGPICSSALEETNESRG